MSKIWVVVADASRARIFTARTPGDGLVELETLTHPEGRLHEGDLVTDRSGRDRDAAGGGGHDMGHTDDAKDTEGARFAVEVCDALEKARVQGEIKKLHVVASPHFLGLLRKQQTAALKKLVEGELSKNLVTKNPEEIRKALPEFL